MNTDLIFVKENTDTIFEKLIFMGIYHIDLTKYISKKLIKELQLHW